MPAGNFFRRLLGTHMDRRQRSRLPVQDGASALVVDDSPTIRAVLAKMLIQNGYAVLRAENGEQALQLAFGERPTLIFLDIVMPGMNGFKVLRSLRQDPRTRDIPIVMISGNVQATEQFYVQRFGADDFMKKPFGRAEVFDRIGRLAQAGRLQVSGASMQDSAAVSDMTDEEMAAIPDVALPDVDTPLGDSASFIPGGAEVSKRR